MISFAQLPGAAPQDIQVTTDDSDGELAQMQENFEEAEATDMQAALNLADAKMENGALSFIVPGAEAGEVGDILYETALDGFLNDLNRKAMDAAEAKGSE